MIHRQSSTNPLLNAIVAANLRILPPPPRTTVGSDLGAIRQASALGIRRLERFTSAEMLREIIANRSAPPESDARPVAVVMYPDADHNGAFALASWRTLMTGYRVVYYEVGSDVDLRAAIADSARFGAPDIVWIGGHGQPEALHLGSAAGERATLDLGDEAKLGGVFTEVARGAHIILDSCSTGAGRDRAANLANMIARMAPQAHVWASEVPTSSASLAVVDGAGRFVNPGFRAANDPRPPLYHIEPAVTGSTIGAAALRPDWVPLSFACSLSRLRQTVARV